MTALYYISFMIFATYITAIILIFGIRKSISDSSYALKPYKAEVFFTLFCWGVSVPMLIYWIDFSATDWNFLPFLACGMLGFVGASPMYQNNDLESKVHNVGSYTCAVGAYLWTFMYGNVPAGLVAISLSIIPLLMRKNKVYWIEMIAFLNLYIQIFPR